MVASWIRVGASLFVLLTVSPGRAHSVEPSEAGGEEVRTQVERGRLHFRKKAYKEAKKAFWSALRQAPGDREALRGLGAVAFAMEDWGDASDWYDRVLEQDPLNRDALYHRAICSREKGKYKATVFRWREWNRAKRTFGKLLAADSLYADAIYQFALLKCCREEYEEAIRLGHRQVALKPDHPGAKAGLFRLYRYLLDNRSPDKAGGWLEAQGSDHAAYFAVEAERLAGRTERADSLLQAWVASGPSIPLVPAYLSLARIFYAEDQDGKAEEFYRRALSSIDGRVGAELVFEDTKYAVGHKELAEFRRLSSSDSGRACADSLTAFFRRFWTRRDPTPASDTNARLAEHYRRLLYAEEHHLYDGFRTWFGSPDKASTLKFPATFYLNDRFNDRGLIYLRHGKPDGEAQLSGPIFASGNSWHYAEADTLPEMFFHFVVDENATGNNWLLAPYPKSVYGLEEWGGSYQVSSRRRGPEYSLQIEGEITRESRKAVDTGFRSDRHSWGRDVESLELNTYPAFFKLDDGEDALEIYYEVSIEDDLKKALRKAESDTTVLLEYGAALHDVSWDRIQSQLGTLTVEDLDSRRHGDKGSGTVRFRVRPDSCHASFFLRQPAKGHIGVWKKDVRIPEFSPFSLDMSSIVPAHIIADDPEEDDVFRSHELHLVPNPSVRFRRSKPVYIYFEVYNLTPSDQGITSFVVEYTISPTRKQKRRKRLSLFGDRRKPSTMLTVERQTEAPVSKEYVSLDLSRVGKGDFRLSIRVRDLNSGDDRERAVDLTLY